MGGAVYVHADYETCLELDRGDVACVVAPATPGAFPGRVGVPTTCSAPSAFVSDTYETAGSAGMDDEVCGSFGGVASCVPR